MLGLAEYISNWSKDKWTKVGAVITDSKYRVISLGFNGFARGIKDSDERLGSREIKNSLMVHAERNALLFAQRDLSNCYLYTWPIPSCSVCASMSIQSGIVKCVSPSVPERLRERWRDDCEFGRRLLEEAGVAVVYIGSENSPEALWGDIPVGVIPA